MRILVVGGGGREHALVWKLAKSPRVTKIYCAPGNPGIGELAECVNISADNVKALCGFAQEHNIDLTVVGPEKPLTDGIVDYFAARGLKVFGPSREAAQLEGSKSFAKERMQKYGVPTADFAVFDSAAAARAYIEAKGTGIVVKADGLAAGKGVVVAETATEALQAIDEIMLKKVHGDAGCQVVLEECLVGEEASLLAFTDGFTVVHADTGAEALRRTLDTNDPVDLVLLDVGLPDLNGLEVLTTIRARSEVSVILVTARSEEVDKLVGLNVGADDYLPKPFDPDELLSETDNAKQRSPYRGERCCCNDSHHAACARKEVIEWHTVTTPIPAITVG